MGTWAPVQLPGTHVEEQGVGMPVCNNTENIGRGSSPERGGQPV